MKTRRISFRISKTDMAKVRKIVERAEALWKSWGAPIPEYLLMDLVACHANGCPMDFARLLEADENDFIHDVVGIVRHLDRTTGRLADCYVPRFAKPQHCRMCGRRL